METPFYFDTHCHLPDGWTPESAKEIIDANRQAGVGRMLLAGTTLEDSRQYQSFSLDYPGMVVCSVGVHPEAADRWCDDASAMLSSWSRGPGVVAIGEIGLDAVYDGTTLEEQQRVFTECLKVADETGLPVVIHCRNAFDQCYPMVERCLSPEHPVQIHCFSDGPRELEAWLKRNCFFSYNGIVTFKKGENVRETLRLVPMERLMLETDSPYLTPVPYRGQENSSKYLPLIAQRIAEERDMTLEQVIDATCRNACGFFRIQLQ